ncbi:MAG: glutamine synthetase [Coriobacteriaceae bacterium]|nr:glutamine synthetase [Coriobacteriaceae bacterium]
MRTPDQDFVLKTIKNRDVHFVRFWFADVLGRLKSFAVIPNELEYAFEEGLSFDGGCVDGFGSAEESDMLAIPDASTFQVLPWRPADNAVGRMFCSVCMPDRSPFEGDPRRVLRRMCERAAEAGYVLNVGPEVEYFYFRGKDDPTPLDNGGSFDLTSLDHASDLRRDTILTLEKMGIPVEYSHHESAPSQHEIDLRFSDAMDMADNVMTYKLVVKEVAMKHGVHASFMPKPLEGVSGSGMHVHQSLFDFDGNNAFYDPDDPDNLSAVAKHYMAGLLKYAPEFGLLANQTVNSYKRIGAEDDAPHYIVWARRNRSALLRVPTCRPGKDASCRIELRSPDPAANPYLLFAAMLAAGLKGIEDGLELPAPVELSDVKGCTKRELAAKGIRPMPETLGEAVDNFEESQLMREVLGEHIHQFLVDEKRREWNEYRKSVSQWELERYLEEL